MAQLDRDFPLPMRDSSSVVAGDTEAVAVRPLTLADCAAYQNFVGRLERNDLRLRFASTVNFARDELCGRFLDIDHREEEALAAIDSRGEILGVARIHRLGPDEADIAIIIRSDRKRRGLGRLLLDHLRTYAAGAGILRLRADILRENYAMLTLARKFGFHAVGTGGIMAEVRLDLEPHAVPQAVATRALNPATVGGCSSPI